MMRVDGHPSLHWQPSPGVRAVDRCPTGGLNEYRLKWPPVLNTLLEHVPGDVPFSTHLELEAARARLVHRAIGDRAVEDRAVGDRAVGEAIDRLGERAQAGAQGGDRVDHETEVDSSEPAAAREMAPKEEPRGRRAELSGRNMDRLERGTMAYTLPRRRWPIGGLIDLVV